METFLAALAGGAIYRARGMGLWQLPRPTWQVLFALPYALAVYFALGPLAAFFVLTFTTGAVLTGHASYIDLNGVKPGAPNAPKDGQVDEWYGTWIPWPGTFAHDFIGLAVSGLLVSAPAGLALAVCGDLTHGVILAASGALKALAYVPRIVIPGSILKDKLWVCEPLAGALLWGSLAAIMGG